MREAGVLIDFQGNTIYWHLPEDRNVAALPDSRSLWDVIWEHRSIVSGFAHSHPGAGVPGPSYTDVTTFAAIESALGKRLDWFITSSDSLSLVRWMGPGKLSYSGRSISPGNRNWLVPLREFSGITIESIPPASYPVNPEIVKTSP